MPSQTWRVLCVEDDAGIADNVKGIFEEWADDSAIGIFQVEVETSFSNACTRLTMEHFDLVTLDLHQDDGPDPKGAANGEDEAGRTVLRAVIDSRFIPVIFYTGFSHKVESLISPVIKVVKKGDGDIENLRRAAIEILATGIPQLVRHIADETRKYLWDTVSAEWSKMRADITESDLAYLLARRLASGLAADSVKDFLNHPQEKSRPIEFYIYPVTIGKIFTGYISDADEAGTFWVVVTPACDFAQKKLDKVLLVGARRLDERAEYKAWKADKERWDGRGEQEDKGKISKFNGYVKFIRNNAGDRYRYLPGTFFLPDCIADFQCLKQVLLKDLQGMNFSCRLDNPYRQDFLNAFSRYYGRLGSPDPDYPEIIIAHMGS